MTLYTWNKVKRFWNKNDVMSNNVRDRSNLSHQALTKDLESKPDDIKNNKGDRKYVTNILLYKINRRIKYIANGNEPL